MMKATKNGVRRFVTDYGGLVLSCIEAGLHEKLFTFHMQEFSRSIVAPVGRKKVRAFFFARKK